MEGNYPILRGGECIGQARVEKRGLYYCFFCQCMLTGEVIYRLTVHCGEKSENLGIPVPQNAGFVLTTRIPVSKLGQGEMVIRAVPRHENLDGMFIPLSPEEPFHYIDRLEYAVLERSHQQLGLRIPADNAYSIVASVHPSSD